jgi:4-hydroxy-3-methylbut-2-enyl diphosphate reductase
MKVLVAEKCGFCPGVRTAIKLANKTLGERGEVFCLGPIIHNEDMVRELAENGLATVDTIEDIDSGTVLIRSHGATLKQLKSLEEKGLEVIDATCVLVKRVQKISQRLNDEGYKVVIIGDKGHPEVQAVVGFTDEVEVVGNEEDIHKLSDYKKLGLICQTTQSPDHFGRMVGEIIKMGFGEVKVVNTLCKETMARQSAAVKLCREVDIMFVLGGLHSANTKKLAQLCKKHNSQTFHLQNWSELDKKVLIGTVSAGVTAGASTPDRIISEFVENLEGI